MRYLIILNLLLMPLSAWGAECPYVDCSLNSTGMCWINPETGCPEIVKSKRQEYVEKCDYFLNEINIESEDLDVMVQNLNNAQLATAYCTRALLEDK